MTEANDPSRASNGGPADPPVVTAADAAAPMTSPPGSTPGPMPVVGADILDLPKFVSRNVNRSPLEHYAALRTVFLHDLLWTRTTLFKWSHALANGHFELEQIDDMRRDVSRYATALQEYKTFQDVGPDVFRNSAFFEQLGKYLEYLDHLSKERPASDTQYHDRIKLLKQRAHTDYMTMLKSRNTHPAHPQSAHPVLESITRIGDSLARLFSIRTLFRGMTKYTTMTGLGYVAEAKARSAFYARLVMALAGGLALIAPMLIMTLHQSRLTSLVTTSVFVFAAAVGLAWGMPTAEPKDVVGATAAYAAVLVVFVGASGTAGAAAGTAGSGNGTAKI